MDMSKKANDALNRANILFGIILFFFFGGL